MSYHFYPKKFVEALKEIGLNECPFCGCNGVDVTPYHFYMQTRTNDDGMGHGVVPYAMFICKKCGHMNLFSLMHENFSKCYVSVDDDGN